MKPITDKPNPPIAPKVAMLMVTIGIAFALFPFGVKFLTGMRSMSDPMIVIAVLGVILLIVGALLAVLSKRRIQNT